MDQVPEPKSVMEEIEVWKTLQEVKWRAEDRVLQEKLSSTPWYKNALIIGILVTAFTIGGNLVASVVNHANAQKTERFRAEGQLVLQALRADGPDRAADNLQLLRDARLITGDLGERIGQYLSVRRPGEGAAIGDKSDGDDALTDISLFVCDNSDLALAHMAQSALRAASFGDIDVLQWNLFEEISRDELSGRTTIVFDEGHPEKTDVQRITDVLAAEEFELVTSRKNTSTETPWRLSIILCDTSMQ